MKSKYGSLLAVLIVFFAVLPQALFAAWQVSSPQASVPQEPFFQTGTQRKTALAPAVNNHVRCKTALAPAVNNHVRGKTALAPAVNNHVRYPSKYENYGQAAPVYAVSISGSLKDNIERIMRRYNWKVVWNAPYDYNFDGKVTGSSLPNVLQKLLQPFPLQAVMYMSNRTVAVVPRQIR